MSLAALLDGPGDQVLVHDGDRSFTRAEIQAMAADLADRLRHAGVAAGQAVAVRLPSTAEAVAALFGVWQAGAVHVPVNPRLTDHEVDRILSRVQPAVVVESGFSTRQPPDSDAARVENGAGEGVALVQFTSGTTGEPKPVPLRHDTVAKLLDGVIERLLGHSEPPGGWAGRAAREPAQPNLVPVSLSLWAGIYQVLFAFRLGAPVVLMDRFDTQRFAELVREHGIRSTVLPPAAMTMLSDDPGVTELTPLRYVRSITAPLSPAEAHRFADRFGATVLNGYGQTELGGEVIGWSAADAREHGQDKLGAVGRPHPGVEVKVSDTGELCVRAAAVVPTDMIADRLDDDGFLRTGDVGRIDDDGFVWIEGRVSDAINRGGFKLWPGEVEEVLRSHPSVTDAAVVGASDTRLGEVPWAYVVPAAGAVDPEALEAVCRERLAPYKVPERYIEIDELPRNEVGKVLYRELAADAYRRGTELPTVRPEEVGR